MEGNDKRVEERRKEDDQNILKISIFHEYTLFSSPSISLYPKHTIRDCFKLKWH
jgi:hypothetical protein